MAQLINKGPKHEARKQSADDRNAEYRDLSISEKIAKLDSKCGKDIGAAKQRKKLAGKVTQPEIKKPDSKEPKKTEKKKLIAKEAATKEEITR